MYVCPEIWHVYSLPIKLGEVHNGTVDLRVLYWVKVGYPFLEWSTRVTVFKQIMVPRIFQNVLECSGRFQNDREGCLWYPEHQLGCSSGLYSDQGEMREIWILTLIQDKMREIWILNWIKEIMKKIWILTLSGGKKREIRILTLIQDKMREI